MADSVCKRVFIGGLAPTVTSAELTERFQRFGAVSDLQLKIKEVKGMPTKVFAHLNLSAPEAKLTQCMTAYNNCQWKGHRMTIQWAKGDFVQKLKEEVKNRSTVVESPPEPDVVLPKRRVVSGAKPGQPVPGEKESEWVVGKFGVALPVLNLRAKDKRKYVKMDPSKFTHCVKRLKDDVSDDVDVEKLTWQMNGECKLGKLQREAENKSPRFSNGMKRTEAKCSQNTNGREFPEIEKANSEPSKIKSKTVVRKQDSKFSETLCASSIAVKTANCVGAIRNSEAPSSASKATEKKKAKLPISKSGSRKITESIESSGAESDDSFEIYQKSKFTKTTPSNDDSRIGVDSANASNDGDSSGAESNDSFEICRKAKSSMKKTLKSSSLSKVESSSNTSQNVGNISRVPALPVLSFESEGESDDSRGSGDTDDIIRKAKVKSNSVPVGKKNVQSAQNSMISEFSSGLESETIKKPKVFPKDEESDDETSSSEDDECLKAGHDLTDKMDESEKTSESESSVVAEASRTKEDSSSENDSEYSDPSVRSSVNVENSTSLTSHSTSLAVTSPSTSATDSDDDSEEVKNVIEPVNVRKNASDFFESSDDDAKFIVETIEKAKRNVSNGTEKSTENKSIKTSIEALSPGSKSTEKSADDQDSQSLTVKKSKAAKLKVNTKNEKHLLDNQKRLQSVKQKEAAMKTQKRAIQEALTNLDSGKSMNKKIKFDSDSDDDAVIDDTGANSVGFERSGDKANNISEKGSRLFDESSGSDEEYDDDDARFSIKPQYEGASGQKLMQLQSTYKNDDRFKLDERFIEDDSAKIVEKMETETPETEVDERTRNMKILSDVVGKSVINLAAKPKAVFKDAVHFDPTRDDHKTLIRAQEPEKEAKKKKKKEKVTQKTPVTEMPEVSKERFYQVETNELKKETSGNKSLFSFFGDDDDDIELEEEPKSTVNMNEKPADIVNPFESGSGPFKYDSSSDDERDDNGGDITQNDDEVMEGVSSSADVSIENRFFFYHGDPRIKKGIESFYAKDEAEEIRKSWLERRDGLIELYKSMKRKRKSLSRVNLARGQSKRGRRGR